MMNDAMAVIPPFHTYEGILADWRPIASYPRHQPMAALLRGGGQAVFGIFGVDPLSDEPVMIWRSLEDSTLDSPLWFEPEQFAMLSDDGEQFYLQR